jgi:hypothetical protein
MIDAYHEIREIFKRGGGAYDLRAASMIDAFDKVPFSYSERGIVP